MKGWRSLWAGRGRLDDEILIVEAESAGRVSAHLLTVMNEILLDAQRVLLSPALWGAWQRADSWVDAPGPSEARYSSKS